jgi:protein required for attachment to host cells
VEAAGVHPVVVGEEDAHLTRLCGAAVREASLRETRNHPWRGGVGSGKHKETKMQVPHNTIVVVADGKKMLFLRNEGDAEFPKLEVEGKREQEDLSDQEMSTDKAGRTFDASGGAGRSAYEETDFHQLEEDRFAHETADMLKKRALNNEFEQLIIVAPPRTLGELRKHYHKEVEKRLTGEIAKDLTGHPVDEIEKILLAQ